MFCNNCGLENTEGSKFCRKCGNPLIIPQITQTEPDPEPPVYASANDTVDEYNSAYIHPNTEAYSELAAERKAEESIPEQMYNIPDSSYENTASENGYVSDDTPASMYSEEPVTPQSPIHEKRLPDMGLIVKKSLKSLLFLLSAVLFSVAAAMFAFPAIPGLIASFENFSKEWLTAVSTLCLILLCVVVTIGLWISFLTAQGKGKCKTAGLNILLIAGILACTISAGSLTVTIYSAIFEIITYGLKDIAANIPDISVLFVFLIFDLVLCSKILRTVSGCRKAAKTEEFPGKASGALPVFCIIYGIFMIALPVILSFVQFCDIGIIAFISCFAFGLSAIFSGINASILKSSINRIKHS